MTKRLAGSIVAGMFVLLAAGGFTAQAQTTVSVSIDSPSSGDILSSGSSTIQVSADTASTRGISYMRLNVSGPNGYSKIIRLPGNGNWTDGQKSRSETFHWTFDSTALSNGVYHLTADAADGSGGAGSSSGQEFNLNVNVPPGAPKWYSTAASGNVVTIKWYDNPEPDITRYTVSRSGGGSGWDVAGSSCGSMCTFTDRSLPSSGYAGDYTYSVRATRSSPVSSGVSGGSTSRTAHVAGPAQGGGGSGGSGGGSGGSGDVINGGGGGTTVDSSNPGVVIPAASPSVDPNADTDPCRFGGSGCPGYSAKLPYSGGVSLIPDSSVKGVKEGRQFALGDPAPMDVRKRLLPLAGGLLTLMAALHFRRVIRDR